MQNISILGATGSIGTNTLAVTARHPDKYRIYALAANRNVKKMYLLCQKWQPNYAVMYDELSANELKKQLKTASIKTIVLSGAQGLIDICTDEKVDTVVAAIVGAIGLRSILAAVYANKRILLANKESLVISGHLFMKALENSSATLLPVDSEHNAIFQCLPPQEQAQLGRCDFKKAGIEHLLLTGSGGPFLNTPLEDLKKVTPERAVAHPNWSMGAKISVDSATMMNKGLEYIEAYWLFSPTPEQIKIVIHPQSMIHSMVQYVDGSVLAQIGNPSMQTPIAHALAYPNRIESGISPVNFSQLAQWQFYDVDFERYPCLKLAIDACHSGQHATIVLNAANEIAVDAFLNKKIAYLDIAKCVENSLTKYGVSTEPKSMEEILSIDQAVREYTSSLI